MHAPVWMLRIADRIGRALVRWSDVPFCCHEGCTNRAVSRVEVEDSRGEEGDEVPVFALVCAECVHKPYPGTRA